jgi:hypothetical protein
VAGDRGEGADGLAGHRHGRHFGHRQLDKEGAAPTWKKGHGFHPLGAWLANTRECPAMLLRPGNAGSNTFTDHKEVLAAALRQVPARFRRKILVRVDGPAPATTSSATCYPCPPRGRRCCSPAGG